MQSATDRQTAVDRQQNFPADAQDSLIRQLEASHPILTGQAGKLRRCRSRAQRATAPAASTRAVQTVNPGTNSDESMRRTEGLPPPYAATQLNADVAPVCPCRQLHRDEGRWRLSSGPLGGGQRKCQSGVSAHLGGLQSAAQQVRVDAFGHRHCGHRQAGMPAGRHRVDLEFVAVQAPTPTTVGDWFGDSVHVSTKS